MGVLTGLWSFLQLFQAHRVVGRIQPLVAVRLKSLPVCRLSAGGPLPHASVTDRLTTHQLRSSRPAGGSLSPDS